MRRIVIFDSKKKALEEIPERDPFTISINGNLICLIRSGEKFYAFKNGCPHAGASLADGFVNELNEIVCPLHGYRFSIVDGREKSGKNCELFQYGIELSEEGLAIFYR